MLVRLSLFAVCCSLTACSFGSRDTHVTSSSQVRPDGGVRYTLVVSRGDL